MDLCQISVVLTKSEGSNFHSSIVVLKKNCDFFPHKTNERK